MEAAAMRLGASAFHATPAPLAPPAANTTLLQAAIRGNTQGVGYAGAGFLLFYYIGVSKVLQQLGVIKPGVTKTAAASVGVLSAAVDYGFANHSDFIAVSKGFAARCRAKHNCAGTLAGEVEAAARRLIPADAAPRLSGRGYIALSSPNALGIPVGDYVVNYTSREDVVSAVCAAVYLPLWSGPNLTTTFRGKPRYDGAFRTPLPCPLGNTTYCVKVAALPPFTTTELLLDGDSSPAEWRGLLQAMNSTLAPKPLKYLLGTAEKSVERPDKVQKMMTGWAAFKFNMPNYSTVDIYPGKYNKNPFSLTRWVTMVLAPGSPSELDAMVDLGVRDAYSWAREQGLIPAGLLF